MSVNFQDLDFRGVKMSISAKKTKYLLVTLVIAMVLMIGAGCTLRSSPITEISAINQVQTSVPGAEYVEQPASSSLNLEQTLADFADLIANVRPSVVAINTETTVNGFFGRAFTQEGAGSGWIIDGNGLIITNNHVIEGTNNIIVTLEDGRAFPAQMIKSAPASDLAVVKIAAENLPALTVGDSSKLKVGNWVVAIGNSLGLGISATKGIISALDISLSDSPGESLNNLIQTDAAINPGNSGGPLLNLAGEVIGINSAKISQVGVEGMGYAISMNEALKVIERLRSQISA